MTRDVKRQEFIAAHGWADATCVPLRQDASARRYYRLSAAKGTRIVMDAAPPFEETSAFAAKQKIFATYGWAVPEISAADFGNGFLLLEDFGDHSFADRLAHGGDAAEFYFMAIDNLIHLHRQSATAARGLPQLGVARLTYLVSWLIEWYVPLVQPETLSRVIREEFFDIWTAQYAVLERVPQHACHLDYQFHNLMDRAGKTGLARVGILDFQDAAFGPVVADLVLLLENARAEVPPAIVTACIERYLAAFPQINRADFDAAFATASAHNAARILGLFARLKIRDGKGQYLQHLPRNLRYFENSLRHPSLSAIRQWFDTYVPPEKRLAIAELRAA
jgi:aminoglycoside/choline kinase family phosphotransferase